MQYAGIKATVWTDHLTLKSVRRLDHETCTIGFNVASMFDSDENSIDNELTLFVNSPTRIITLLRDAADRLEALEETNGTHS